MEPLQSRPFVPAQVPSVEMVPGLPPESPPPLPLPAVQLPKAVWQPVPQCSAAPPHQPLDEQQSPKPEPRQIFPLGPHLPSEEMLLSPAQVPKALWQAVPQCADESPHQFPDEQHAPKVELVQVNWFEPPQEPSGDASPGPGGFTGGGGGASQFPKVGWLRNFD